MASLSSLPITTVSKVLIKLSIFDTFSKTVAMERESPLDKMLKTPEVDGGFDEEKSLLEDGGGDFAILVLLFLHSINGNSPCFTFAFKRCIISDRR
jgi:hypothetical protein